MVPGLECSLANSDRSDKEHLCGPLSGMWRQTDTWWAQKTRTLLSQFCFRELPVRSSQTLAFPECHEKRITPRDRRYSSSSMGSSRANSRSGQSTSWHVLDRTMNPTIIYTKLNSERNSFTAMCYSMIPHAPQRLLLSPLTGMIHIIIRGFFLRTRRVHCVLWKRKLGYFLQVGSFTTMETRFSFFLPRWATLSCV